MDRNDTTNVESRGAERVAGILLAGVLVIGGAALAYRYGPMPEARADAAGARAAETSRPAPESSNAPILAPFETLGLATNRTAVGRSALGASEFLDSVERTYVMRKFVRGDLQDGRATPVAQDATRSSHPENAFYFRSECPIQILVGIGRNANPAPEPSAVDPDFAAYLTIANPLTGGGSEWATYRFDRNAAAALSKIRLADDNGDFPGVDPPGLPRVPGSRRLLVVPRLSGSGSIAMYDIRAPIADVRAFYTSEMERLNWKLDSYQTLEIARTGALIYNMGALTCTLWIQQKRDDGDRVGIVVVTR